MMKRKRKRERLFIYLNRSSARFNGPVNEIVITMKKKRNNIPYTCATEIDA